MIYINLILLISGICAIVGFCTFVVEATGGRIQRSTPWSELNHYQMEVVVLTILGTTVFLSTMIVAAILKSHQLIS